MSDWAKALQKYVLENKTTPPEKGWKTVNQIADEVGISRCHASRQVNKLVKLGQAEMRMYELVISGSKDGGRRPYSRPIPHYRVKTRKNQRA